MSPPTTLVTGATGFLGRRIAERADGRVIASGRNRKKLADIEASLGCDARAADLSKDPLGPLVRGVDTLIHCAGLSTQWAPCSEFVDGNEVATSRLLRAAEDAGVRRVVFISTSSVYARARDQFGLRESDPLPARPANDYAKTKLAAEKLIRQSAIPHVILRPRAIYGPRDTTIFPRLMRGLRTGFLPIIGRGDAIADLTYVDDIADASNVAASATVEGTFNITSGDPVRIWDLIERLARDLSLPPPRGRVALPVAMAVARGLEFVALRMPSRPEPILTRFAVAQLGTSCTLDISKAESVLGFTPKVRSAEGLERFVESLR